MFVAMAVVKNEAGIHCRPSAILVKEGIAYPGEILVTARNGSSNLKSVLELIVLGLEQGANVKIEVTGPDEITFGHKLVALFETYFDFPPR